MEKEKRKYTKKLKPEEASPIPVSEAPVVPIVPVESAPVKVEPPVNAVTTLARDAWRYHEAEEPRIFKAGTPIPVDWHASPKDLKRSVWAVNDLGKWTRKDKG